MGQGKGEKEPVRALSDDVWQLETGYHSAGTAACYLLRGGDQWALVDCGSGLSVPRILAALDALEVPRAALRYVIPTHVHLDHAGGAGGLMQALPDAELWAHPRATRHLVDPSQLLAGAMAVYGEEAFRRLNGEILPVPAERVQVAEDGQALRLGPRRLECLDAPGHARHHLVVWDEQSRGFFTGDVFGLGYPALEIDGRPFMVPTTTPVQFDPPAWIATLDRLLARKPRRMYLTHYGPVDDPAALAPELEARIAAHADAALADPGADTKVLALWLGEALYDDYARAGGTLAPDAFRAMLAMDLDLNAQGLIVWRDRQLKESAQ